MADGRGIQASILQGAPQTTASSDPPSHGPQQQQEQQPHTASATEEAMASGSSPSADSAHREGAADLATTAPTETSGATPETPSSAPAESRSPGTGASSPHTERPPRRESGSRASLDASQNRDEANEAVSVRRNMMHAMWQGFNSLGRARRWLIALRMMLGLAQVALGIVVLSLPSSYGSSGPPKDICDPRPMVIYLALHTARTAVSIPIDVYLGLSPHRTSSARREGPQGQERRERERIVGNLALDKKMLRISDLLGLLHIVIFVLGNFVTWDAVSCAGPSAKSQPLFFACVAILSLSYVIVVEVALLLFLVIFFLPLVIIILRALGLGDRLPRAGIHPETGKIPQETVDQKLKLVYYTPAEEEGDAIGEEPEANDGTTSAAPRRSSPESLPIVEELAASSSASSGKKPIDEEAPPSLQARDTSRLTASSQDQQRALDRSPSRDSISTTNQPPSPRRTRRPRLSKLLGRVRQRDRSGSSSGEKNAGKSTSQDETGDEIPQGMRPLKYPLHPLPAHRATCPICLCDFEKPPAMLAEGEDDPEPLRLMDCSHCMHQSCVDVWLTTISGRCPVCQRPVLEADRAEEDATADEAEANRVISQARPEEEGQGSGSASQHAGPSRTSHAVI